MLKLKDVIEYFEEERVKIYVDGWDTVDYEPNFEGYIFDIPWIYLDLYLHNDSDCNSISLERDVKTNQVFFAIYLKEGK